jgi:hypothetical protein
VVAQHAVLPADHALEGGHGGLGVLLLRAAGVAGGGVLLSVLAWLEPAHAMAHVMAHGGS